MEKQRFAKEEVKQEIKLEKVNGHATIDDINYLKVYTNQGEEHI